MNVIVNSDPNSVSSVRSSPEARVILQSLHIGPEARAIFNLVEEYKPLSQAYNEKNSKWFEDKLSNLHDNINLQNQRLSRHRRIPSSTSR